MDVRRLTMNDWGVFLALRRKSLEAEPLAYASSVGDDPASADRSQLDPRDERSAVFGAFLPELVGMAGVFRGRHLKYSHKAFLWGMFVDPTHRGQGIGGRLIDAVIAHAKTMPGVDQLHLSVTDAADGARRLYERRGFSRWGTEPGSICHDGRRADEHHMILEWP